MSSASDRLRDDDGAARPESRVEVHVTTDTSVAPHKIGEARLYVLRDAVNPQAGELYFTQAEWDAFVAGVKNWEFDLDESGNLPDLQ